MAEQGPERPAPEPLPGTWPTESFKEEYLHPHSVTGQDIESAGSAAERSFLLSDDAVPAGTEGFGGTHLSFSGDSPSELNTVERVSNTPSSDTTLKEVEALQTDRTDSQHPSNAVIPGHDTMDYDNSGKDKFAARDKDNVSSSASEAGYYEPIRTNQTRPTLAKQGSKAQAQEEMFGTLSRKWTKASERQGSHAGSVEDQEDQEEIQRLMSRMFGANRKAQSEDEKTRHVGVIWKHLTVKGIGLGAALQPTIGDPFLAPFRLLRSLFSKSHRVGGKPPVRTLLNDFSGCVRPGEMLLVLGRPGAGCSTFLKMFGNQRFGYKEIKGDVTYGGTSAEKMGKNFRGEVLYNPEDDLHYATLSVKNTLQFALRTKTPGKASRNEGESRSDYVREFLRVVTKLFWIEHTLNTKVGNEYVRGVSGGEKKRVSIAEAMITRASCQAWDNSTRGLDASTALEYVQAIRTLTNMAQISTAVALYQAGESLFDLFDKVILIEEGRCLYFGPTENAAAYFEGLGFQRPARWNTADFLTSVTDPHERQVREGWEERIPRSSEQFEAAFAKSLLQEQNMADIANFEESLEAQRRERQAASSKATKKKNYSLPFHKQVLACTQRQALVMIGDKQSLGGKWGGVLFQSLIVGSLFYNLPDSSSGVFPRGGVLFFMLLFNALLALSELTAAFSSRPIMLKHKSFSFYRPAAYALAQTVIDVPLVFVQVFLFDIVVYFMAGLARTPSQFFISLLLLFFLTMTMYAFFRAIGALVSSLDVATRITGVAIQALITYTGYLIPPNSMHPWFKWIMYINPVAYGFEALMTNEFYELNIQCQPPYLVPIGPGVTPQHQSCLIQGSRPGQTTVSGSDYVNVAYSYTRDHLWRNFGIIIAFFVFFVLLTMIGMEIQKPNAGGGAVTIFKRGQAPRSVEKAMQKGGVPGDEEKVDDAAEKSLEDESSRSETEKGTQGIAKNDTIFTFQDISYEIPVKEGRRQLLRDVQGFVRPGRLTALMGASGAGKTTLLNTLAQRIDFGVIAGDFLVDGRPLPKSFQRATGFAEQMDVHEPTATVREALRFSALLRQPKEVTVQEKYDYCETIIDLLEMRSIAGALIGTIGEGLNQEQRKRLTIGVELASKPELLMFLDEPTSGLDSGAAFNIIRFLRKLADAGQAILCTIHQPSSVLFEHFDELILLKSGGRIVYHGELGKGSRTLIEYFESNGAKHCPSEANPAEYMLEAIGAGDPNYKGKDWGDVWAASSEHEARTREIQDMIASRQRVTTGSKTDDSREYAMPMGTQVLAVIKRDFVSYFRAPDYLLGKFVLHIFTGLFNGFTFWRAGNSTIDMQSRLFSIFMTLTIAPPLIQQLQPRYLGFRQVYQARERNSKIYSWFAFTVGAVLVELPYSLLAGTLYMFTWWWTSIGWPGADRTSLEVAYVWLMLMLFEMYYVGFGQAIASFSPNELLASLLVPVFLLFVLSFAGVVVPYAALPHFWQSWMYWLSPFRYLLEGLLAAAVHGVPVQCSDNEFARFAPPSGVSCKQYTKAYVAEVGGYVQTAADGMCEFCQYANGDEFAAGFNVYYANIWRNYGIFWAFVLFNFALVFLCSYLYLSGGKRVKAVFSGRKGGMRKNERERKGEAQGEKA